MRKLVMGCAVAALTAFAPTSAVTPATLALLRTHALATSNIQVGVASWYGAAFQGYPTASGPPFDMNAMTCAHRFLPLGTWIRVTDLVNYKSVTLKVNDRGPYVYGRVLDVSRAAARHLGFLAAGLAPVRIEVISFPRHDPAGQSGATVIASHTN